MNQPYQAPTADVSAGDNDTYQPSFFAASGRIGRMRYVVYAFGLTMLSYLSIAVVGGIMAAILGGFESASANSGATIALGFLAMAVMLFILVMTVIYAIRRLNDFNASGWFVLLFLIPVVNLVMGLVLVFMPGTRGANKFGPKPVPNSGGVIAAFVVVMVLFVGYIGMLMAVAIPAYNQYVERAQQASQMQYNDDY
ncbi:MAG: DUF805 domain-containing protein [Pseudomonadota bacterium]|nr:DUF805 domain-containing protein [Pseudomonadota bacterium]